MMVWWSLPWRGQARRHDAWWRRQHWPVVAEYLPPGTERPLTGWGQFRHGGNQASSWSRTPPVTSSCRRRPCLAHPCPHEVSGPTYYLSATVPAPRAERGRVGAAAHHQPQPPLSRVSVGGL